MTNARWQQVKALFQATVERPPSERAPFLAAAAGGDDALRREVESLLDSDSSEMDFADRLAFRDRAPLALESLLLASEQAERFIEEPALAEGVTLDRRYDRRGGT